VARHAVTLVTGDQVQVLDAADGTHSVAVTPARGREDMPFFKTGGRDAQGHDVFRVVPADAQVLVSSGRLDPRLFDVLGLVRMGYDDAARADLPLILTYASAPGAQRAMSVGGARLRRELPSVNGASVRPARSAAGAFWTSVTGTAGAVRPAVATMLTGDVARIWLDGRSKVRDDVSNAQIGVPTAWQAGFTGKGVTVAVLDSGYDATHPDLTTVADAKDFTGSPVGAKDEFGHGTHVAGIIAGSGAASAGKYRGVAPTRG
jgi:subtilisin family serine protease